MQAFATIERIEAAGLDGLIVYFQGRDLTAANQAVQHCVAALRQASPDWLRELLPAYDSLVIIFNPMLTDDHGVYQALRALDISNSTEAVQSQHHNLPVWYGGQGADDFEHIEQHTGLSREQVIELHSSLTLRVFAVGFAPGFGYLGELPEQLSCPRLKTPRNKVPAGAVAIADRQAAVYPQSSPGGWNLLGLCPLAMFDIRKQPASLLQVGDTVQFQAIDRHQYQEMLNE